MPAALDSPIDAGQNVDALLVIADRVAGDELVHARPTAVQ
jgi:hypothetical protein